MRLSLQFWKESDQNLGRAVKEANAEKENRVVFVPAPFTEDNSVFAQTPWLFGLDADLSPQDEVVASRHHSCDVYFDDPIDLGSREQCYRASAGHPNVAGSQQIATEILGTVG